jgi:hypothetical protein
MINKAGLKLEEINDVGPAHITMYHLNQSKQLKDREFLFVKSLHG